MYYWQQIRWGRIAILALAMLTLIALLVKNVAPLRIDLSSDAWAAWVQAVGSIFAILVAVLIPALQHAATKNDANEAEIRRARVLALSNLPTMRAYGLMLMDAKRTLDTAVDKRQVNWKALTLQFKLGKFGRRMVPDLHKYSIASTPLINFFAEMYSCLLKGFEIAHADEPTIEQIEDFEDALGRCTRHHDEAESAMKYLAMGHT